MIRYRPMSTRPKVLGLVTFLCLFGYIHLAAQAPLTSANVSKDQLKAIAAGEKTITDQVLGEVWQNFVKCLQIH